jgi:hypothetical protein
MTDGRPRAETTAVSRPDRGSQASHDRSRAGKRQEAWRGLAADASFFVAAELDVLLGRSLVEASSGWRCASRASRLTPDPHLLPSSRCHRPLPTTRSNQQRVFSLSL